jgi:hypothetical protein
MKRRRGGAQKGGGKFKWDCASLRAGGTLIPNPINHGLGKANESRALGGIKRRNESEQRGGSRFRNQPRHSVIGLIHFLRVHLEALYSAESPGNRVAVGRDPRHLNRSLFSCASRPSRRRPSVQQSGEKSGAHRSIPTPRFSSSYSSRPPPIKFHLRASVTKNGPQDQ